MAIRVRCACASCLVSLLFLIQLVFVDLCVELSASMIIVKHISTSFKDTPVLSAMPPRLRETRLGLYSDANIKSPMKSKSIVPQKTTQKFLIVFFSKQLNESELLWASFCVVKMISPIANYFF